MWAPCSEKLTFLVCYSSSAAASKDQQLRVVIAHAIHNYSILFVNQNSHQKAYPSRYRGGGGYRM
jgi:hypothetical protein